LILQQPSAEKGYSQWKELAMVTKESINAALDAHAQWKKRLMDAIGTGKSEFKAEEVSKDNRCQFGQWLYKLPSEDTRSEDFRKVQQLHAEFHRVAGSILSLALAGKKDEALSRLDYKGDYGLISGKLVLALNRWKDSAQ
jgi:hypothetical protein